MINKINWKTRMASKEFWIGFIPAILLFVDQFVGLINSIINMVNEGVFNMSSLSAALIAIVGSIFAILVMLGVINDPNTKGWKDSERSQGYTEPWDDNKHIETETISEANTNKEE